MARNLRLQVMLNAVDRVTGPLKRVRQGAGQTSQAMRETRDQLKELQRTQSDLSSYRKANAAQRQNTRAMRDARTRNHQYTQALEQQREAHANVKSGLTVARREYDRLARELLRTKQPSDQLTASLERARVRLHGQQTEFDRSTRALREYRNRTRHAGEEVKRLTQNHATQTERIRGLKTRLDEAGISTDNLGRSSRELRTKEDRLNNTLQEQKRHLSEVADRQRRLTQARDRYQNGMANVARAQGVGMGMFGTGIAQGYAASRLLTPGVAWGEQMSTLQAVGRFGADDERYQALREQSRELGGSTAFSATEVGGGQEFLLRAGMSAEAIQASMRDVLDLALANNTELARAADIASNIAGTFKIDMEADGAMARVADILSGTASRANVNLEMLGETMKYLGGSEDLDLTMEQAAAMAGLMGNIGIQGSMAGTAMRAMANRLTDPAKAGRDAMEQLNLKVADASGNMRAMPDILRDINNATRDLGNVERRALLSQIFGAEAGSGMTELVNGMSEGMLDDLIGALQTNAGENAQMARVMADNLGGDLKSLRSAWEEVGISITDTNNGPLRDLVQNITTITRGVGEWIKANPELAGTIAKVAAGMIALATVGGAVTMTFASILSPLLFAKFAMTTLGIKVGSLGTALGWIAKTAIPWVAGALKGLFIAMGPIGWGIAAIAGAAFLIYKYWEPIKAFFVGLWQQVKAAFDEGVGGVARLLINWSPLGLIYRAFTHTLERLGVSVPEVFRTLGGFVIDGLLSGLGAKLAALREWVTGMASGIATWFKDVLGINSPSRVFEGFGINIVEGMINGIASMAGALRDQVMSMAGDIAGWVQEAMTSAWDSIGDGANRAMQWGRDTAAGMGQGIRDGASRATESAANLANDVTGTMRSWLDINSPSRVFATIGGFVSQGLANGIEDDADSPVKQVRSLTSRMRDAATGLMLSAGVTSPAMAIDVQPPELPPVPGLYTHIERPELPTLETLKVEHPALPELGALTIQRPEVPAMLGLTAHIEWPELPTLEALQVERPSLPELGALTIQRPELPAMPGLTAHIERPERPRLEALQVERPSLPELGALTIQRPELPAMPGLTARIERPELPRLEALQVERPTLPALGALTIQRPELPAMPGLTAHIERPELPHLEALQVEHPALPELGALTIQRPELPTKQRLTTHIERPELPRLEALQVERPTLPALGALTIQRPELPAMPGLTAHIERPELPTLEAQQVERPALPELGALTIQRPEVPAMPGLTAHIERPELPTLEALQVERPTLPELGALTIQRPAMPAMPGLTAHIERPELPTLEALQVERPTLPELGALTIQRPELPTMPGLTAHIERPELPTLEALQLERPTLPALSAPEIQRPELPQMPRLTANIERPELPKLEALTFQWPELPQFDPLRIDTNAIQIDARPPLENHASAAPSGGLVIHGGINIEVHAAPGMDEQALARLVNEQVQRALQDAERRAAAASRRNFYDND